MSKCIRCEKDKADIHTCSPSNNWRKAMDEGYDRALDDIKIV